MSNMNGKLISCYFLSLRRSYLLSLGGISGDWGYVRQQYYHERSRSALESKPKLNWQKKSYYKYATLFGSALATCGVLFYYVEDRKRNVLSAKSLETLDSTNQIQPGDFKPGLPNFSRHEVSQHSGYKEGVWVTFSCGVYDITHFIGQHPGGERLLMAAGGALEPFWILYNVHNKPEVLNVLEKYRIGNLSPEDVVDPLENLDDPYGLDPQRHPALQLRSAKPFNAETPVSLLVESFITPTDLFYVRNHLPVPDVDPKTYKLELSGIGIRSQTLSLDQLKTKFPKHTITATIQCAGNRRSEMTKVKAVKGLDWGQAAIGNATWSGARLCDVLKAAGLKEGTIGLEHVHLEGLDEYGASIPVEKALDPHGDVLLAYEMNGQPLTRDHGSPVRAIVPGVTGARNVKWLGDITLSGVESSSHWQQNDYKGFSPNIDWDTVDFSKSPAIQSLPVTSAICQPENGEKVTINKGHVSVKGYAWSGGGQKIIRVDVSADRGKSWHTAEITAQGNSKAPRHWGWTLWQIDIPVPKGTKQVELCCKAVDSTYNTQPEMFESIWNLRGVISNAYHRVKIHVQ